MARFRSRRRRRIIKRRRSSVRHIHRINKLTRGGFRL